mmetsp:Transcript_3168/g.2148  ORF Transcript_3168/g.2148 Transcript_3168/m.2148 type:complete len:94 (-) Transcript_3168:610-891(-)
MHGPYQGGIGLLSGTRSLVTHSASATFGSVGKIVNSLNKGILYLSNDTQFIQTKEIKSVREKPKGGFDGLKKGFGSAFTSLGSGISGVVTKPV